MENSELTPTPRVDETVLVAQLAASVGLPVTSEALPAVAAQFAQIAAIAPLVTEFPLPPETEPAPTFEP